MAAPEYEHWDVLVSLLQSYAQRKYGQPAIALTLHLQHGQRHVEPLPVLAVVPQAPAARTAAVPTQSPPEWASGCIPKRLSDCQRIYWPGQGEFRFAPKQAAVVKLLWEAYEDGSWEVPQTVLMAAAGSDGRLYDLFKNHRARPIGAGRLIITGETGGTFRLTPLPEDDPEG